MEATVKLEDVLNLVREHQEDLAGTIDAWSLSTTVRSVLWDEYKGVSKLIDDIRRLA